MGFSFSARWARKIKGNKSQQGQLGLKKKKICQVGKKGRRALIARRAGQLGSSFSARWARKI